MIIVIMYKYIIFSDEKYYSTTYIIDLCYDSKSAKNYLFILLYT